MGWDELKGVRGNGRGNARLLVCCWARADRVISRIRRVDGNVLLFSSGHILRVLIARWLGLEVSRGGYFKLGTAALSILGYDHNNLEERVVQLLNEMVK